MRHKLVFGVLALLLGGLGASLAMRGRTPHDAPRPPPDDPAAASGAPVASGSGSAPVASASAPVGDAGPGMLMPRPLRVAGLGWESVAPCILAMKGKSADAPSPFAAAHLEVAAKGVERLETLESALGRGGEDVDGADIAILPLASFVAAYERLRALSPEIFFVVGWSRGREALLSVKDPLVSPPTGEVRVAGVAGDAATFFGLAALDLSGTPPDRVKLVATTKADEVALAAIDRGGPSDAGSAKLRMTTADASRLVPLVAVAQRGTIEKHGPALVAWARVWLDAQRTLESDPAAAARVVSTAQGAPEPIALLRRLGELAPAPLADNARAAGLSGRGAVTLESLFQTGWRIWRAAGVLATPAPESAPVSTAVIAALARSHPALVQPIPAPKPKTPTDKAKVLLVHRHGDAGGKVDEVTLLPAIGMLAGVFERAPLRVTVRGAGGVDAKRTQKLIEAAQGQFDLLPGRLVAGTKAIDKTAAAVEVLEVP